MSAPDHQEGQQYVVPNAGPFSAFTLNFSCYEMWLALGNVQLVVSDNPEEPIERVVVDWFATLLASPQTIKRLSSALAAVVAAYEGQFGVIPVEPDLQGDQIKVFPTVASPRYN